MSSRLRTGVVGVVAACAVISVWLAVGQAYRYNDVDEVREKMAWFGERKDEYDVVMVGASGIRSQIAPDTFDRVMAQHGHAFRSFNMGVSDMVPPEEFYLIDRIVEARPGKVKYVIIGASPIRVDVSEGGMETAKVVYWHSPSYAADAVRLLWLSDAAIGEKVKHTVRHASVCIRNTLQAGRGPSALETLCCGPRMDMNALGPLRDGFVSYDDYLAMGMTDVRWIVDDFQRREQTYREKEVRALRGEVDTVFRLDDDGLRYYADMTGRLDRKGIKTFVVILPQVLVDTRPMRRLGNCPGVVGVVDLNDPIRYPEFFRFENKADAGHLDEKTARLLTERVAESFAAAIAK